jgi:hypothetical protein
MGAEYLPPNVVAELFQIEASSKDNYDEKTEIILEDILRKIRKPFERLEILTANESEPQRSAYLSSHLTMALLSSDPVRTIEDTVYFIEAFRMRKRIASYISRTSNFT